MSAATGFMIRGIVWFGLYTIVTLLPLGAALVTDPIHAIRPFHLEFAVGLGFIAFALIVTEFALVSRVQAASAPFGTDALMRFHRSMGLAALAFVATHALSIDRATLHPDSWLGITAGRVRGTGTLALAALALLVMLSVWRRRLRMRYEAWQRVHRIAAILIVGASLVHALAAAGYTRHALVAGILIFYSAVFLALLVNYRGLRLLRLARRPWELLENRPEGASAHTLVLRPIGHDGFLFEPGQFVWLLTGRSPLRSEQHPVSIASTAERAGNAPLELTIKSLGDWSGTTVPALRPGQRMWLDGPAGAFSPDRVPAQGFVLIAGGIGITPLRSMILSLRDREDRRPVLLFYAARSFERVVFRSELEQLARDNREVRIVWVLEDPPPGWQGERGFIDGPMLGRHLPAQWRRYQYFVCGPPAMMDRVTAALTSLGIADERIQTERFDLI